MSETEQREQLMAGLCENLGPAMTITWDPRSHIDFLVQVGNGPFFGTGYEEFVAPTLEGAIDRAKAARGAGRWAKVLAVIALEVF